MSVVSKGLSCFCFAVSDSLAEMLPMLCGKLAPVVWKVAVGDTLKLGALVSLWAVCRMGISWGVVMMTVFVDVFVCFDRSKVTDEKLQTDVTLCTV